MLERITDPVELPKSSDNSSETAKKPCLKK